MLAVCLLAGCAASSLTHLSRVDTAFVEAAETWDLDHDSVVTCDEWKAYVRDLFQQADANHDGALSRQEFATLTSVDKLFETADHAYFDANGDGMLSLTEFADKPNPAFKYLDKNKDCRLTNDELPTDWANFPSNRAADHPGRQGRGRSR